MSTITYPFVTKLASQDNLTKIGNKNPFVTELAIEDNFIKIGDKHHFSATDMFSTPFDYTFFNSLFNNSKKSLVYIRSLTRVLSRINIIFHSLFHHIIYKDESFSSIRDPERCIRIMRWAHKNGIYEKLEDNLDFKEANRRLRGAFIIGFSVPFWICLSDQKPSSKENSFRKKFIEYVCEYWRKLLRWDTAEVKDSFPSPNYNEWTGIVTLFEFKSIQSRFNNSRPSYWSFKLQNGLCQIK